MRKETKKGTCDKCGLYFYIHEHHILPKAIFGKKRENSNTLFQLPCSFSRI
jgi:hypothetical protein